MEPDKPAQTPDEAEELKVKKRERRDKVFETVRAVLLGVATLLVAWSTWIGSLHTGLQETHFTESNNLASSATVLYSDASELLVQDIMTWNSILDCYLDSLEAQEKGDELAQQVAEAKFEILLEECSPEFKEAITWALEEEKSPFEKEGYIESYYTEADDLLQQSQAMLEEGKSDNLRSDRNGLATVIFSLVLFLLGIAGTFKHSSNRTMVMVLAVVFLAIGLAFMLSIDMPTGFTLGKYLAVGT